MQFAAHYKTDYLVLRKIPAKGMTFRMGSPSGENGKQAANNGAPNGTWDNDAGWNQETAHQVTLTNDFYLGVYELTRKQGITYTGYGNPGSVSGYEAYPVGGDNHAIRGGSYAKAANHARAAHRQDYVNSGNHWGECGFRLWAPAIAK